MTCKNPKILALARAMRASGQTYTVIGDRCGVDPDTAHQWVDPAYAAKRAARKRTKADASGYQGMREYALSLPTLAFVPFIELRADSRYQMRAP